MKINSKKLIVCFFYGIGLVFYIYFLLSCRDRFDQDSIVKISCISAFIILLFEIAQVRKMAGKLLLPSFMFLMSFYIFQNGQLLLYSLGIDFNSFYIMTLNQYMDDVSIFSSISTVIAGYAAILTTQPNSFGKIFIKQYYVDKIDKNIVAKAAELGFIFSGIVAIPLVLLKFYISLGGGYAAVRSFETTVPSIINFIEYMFMPFSLLLMVFSDDLRKKVVIFFIGVWALLTVFCGDRTTGIGALLIIAYLSYINEKSEDNKKIRIRTLIKFAVSGMLLLILIPFGYAVRTKSDFSITSMTDLLVTTIAELGFSCFPLFTMMYTVPNYEEFLLGKGYILSFIGGWIPSFVDFTGTIRNINQQSRIFETWQTKYFGQYSFGFGFSLNAEAYINFGWWGLFAIFILCIFIFKFLGNGGVRKKGGWLLYRTSALLFLWFTLSRRDSYYIWKAILYSIIIMKLYLFIMCQIISRRKHKRGDYD